VQYIIKGNPKHTGGLRTYQEYIRFLTTKFIPFTEEELDLVPYLDYLQAPLQVRIYNVL
jgi:hypothetical protein